MMKASSVPKMVAMVLPLLQDAPGCAPRLPVDFEDVLEGIRPGRGRCPSRTAWTTAGISMKRDPSFEKGLDADLVGGVEGHGEAAALVQGPAGQGKEGVSPLVDLEELEAA